MDGGPWAQRSLGFDVPRAQCSLGFAIPLRGWLLGLSVPRTRVSPGDSGRRAQCFPRFSVLCGGSPTHAAFPRIRCPGGVASVPRARWPPKGVAGAWAVPRSSAVLPRERCRCRCRGGCCRCPGCTPAGRGRSRCPRGGCSEGASPGHPGQGERKPGNGSPAGSGEALGVALMRALGERKGAECLGYSVFIRVNWS